MEQNVNFKIDEKDLRILSALKENSKLSTWNLSKKINLPVTTIHHRIKKLEKIGVITKYTLELDEEKLGKHVLALVLVTVGVDKTTGFGVDHDTVAREILKFPEVQKVYTITGMTDILVKVRTKDNLELNKFLIKRLRKLAGIERTQTSIVLSEFKK